MRSVSYTHRDVYKRQVKKSGAWYTYDGDQLGQGMENSRRFLIANPDIAAEIEDKILICLLYTSRCV